jgi:hypothetical protein
VATNGEIGSETPQFMKHRCVFAKGTMFFGKGQKLGSGIISGSDKDDSKVISRCEPILGIPVRQSGSVKNSSERIILV